MDLQLDDIGLGVILLRCTPPSYKIAYLLSSFSPGVYDIDFRPDCRHLRCRLSLRSPFRSRLFVTHHRSVLLGRKTVYVSGIALFGLFSLIQSLVHNPVGFFVTRALSGVGAAMIFASTSGKRPTIHRPSFMPLMEQADHEPTSLQALLLKTRHLVANSL